MYVYETLDISGIQVLEKNMLLHHNDCMWDFSFIVL